MNSQISLMLDQSLRIALPAQLNEVSSINRFSHSICENDLQRSKTSELGISYMPLIRDNTGIINSEDFPCDKDIKSFVVGSFPCKPSVLNDSFNGNKDHCPIPPYSDRASLRNKFIAGDDFYINIREKTTYELIEEMNDDFPFLEFRKVLRRLKNLLSDFFRLIVSTSLFEGIILIVILMNTVALVLEDPLSTERDSVLLFFDEFFLTVYTVEAILKILGMGLIFNKKAYLRDSWNILDFGIVVAAWLEQSIEEGVNLSALRVLRVLRPLRSISSIEGLRALITALFNSFKPLMVSMVLFLFFLSIFAIAGVNLFMEIFRMKCMNLETGEFLSEEICQASSCPEFSECVNSLDNLNYGITNFDNFLYAFLAVFQSVTLEGWTGIMLSAQKGFNAFVIIYFVPLVFIGAFLLLNFILAVLKVSFTRAMNEVRESKKIQLDTEVVDHLNTSLEHKKTLSEDPVIIEEDTSSNETSKVLIKHDNKALKFNEIQKEIMTSSKKFIIQINESVNFSSHMISAEPNHSKLEWPEQKAISYRFADNGAEIINEVPSFKAENEQGYTNTVPTIQSGPQKITYRMMTRSLLPTINKKNTILTFLSSKGGVIRVKKEIVNQLRSGENFETFVPSLPENTVLTSSSIHDILPQTEDPTETNQNYSFKYSNAEATDLGNSNEEFKQFDYYCVRYRKSTAFHTVHPSVSSMIEAIREKDKLSQNIIGHWSGQDINQNLSAKSLPKLSTMHYRRWTGAFQTIDKMRYVIRSLVTHRFFINSLIIAVLLNTIVLAMDHHGISEIMQDTLNVLNYYFTLIFIVEMVLKLIGIGVVEYLKDPMNYLDAIVVILSSIEIVFLSGDLSGVTVFRTVRIFRTFRALRVLRVARLLRYTNSMSAILSVLSDSIYSFFYLALLLVLCIVIFALLGMQIFGGQFQFASGTPRANFDSFHNSFITVFQILSMEGWDNVLYDAMRSPIGGASAFYFILWIFIGNYVILKLFLAIVLDAFDQKLEENSVKVDCEDDLDESLILENSTRARRNSLLGIKAEERAEKKRKKNEAELIKKLSVVVDDPSYDDSRHIEDLKVNQPRIIVRMMSDETDCTRSYYIFSKNNALRRVCHTISNSQVFETIILLIICLSTVKLIWDTYLLDEPDHSLILQVFYYLDIFFTVCFVIEFLVKSISAGFLIAHGSYLKESWNQIDFLIVVFSVLELAVQSVDIPFIKVLRILRTLRPLRFISHNISMKFVVIAILESLFAIMNVAIVLFIFWLMFAILGVSLFAGKFYSCENPAFETIETCELYGYSWVNADSNFDNVIEAMISLFIVSSLEGWPGIMHSAVDAKGVGVAPTENYNPAVAYYFIIFILIGSFFFVNLFIGVVFMQFNKAKQNETSSYRLVLDYKQVRWIEIQKFIVKSRPGLNLTRLPKVHALLLFHNISKSKTFEMFILGCILLNMLQMAVIYEGSSDTYTEVLEIINYIFTAIFILEALVKILGLGPKAYFYSNWNKFDFFVVMTSMFDFGIGLFLNRAKSFLSTAPQLARVIRILRVTRLLRIFKALKSLQDLITIMTFTLPAIINVLSLLILIFIIYSVLGVFIFHEISEGTIIDDYTNFSNWGMAMLTLLRISTGEDWNLIMYDCSRQGSTAISVLYFCSFITITMFVMLNLFTMVIVQTYQDYEKDPKNSLLTFSSEVRVFNKVWQKYSQYVGARMEYQKLPEFMYVLGDANGKLGLEREVPYSIAMKILSMMNLYVNKDGLIYYNDLLYAVMKRKHVKRSGMAMNQYSKVILKQEEKSTWKALKNLRECRNSEIQGANQTESKYSQHKDLFFTMVFTKSILRGWRQWVQSHKSDSSVTPLSSCVEFPGDNSLSSN